MKNVLSGLFLGMALLVTSSIYAEEAKVAQVAAGKTVKFDYTLTVDGKTVDSSEGAEPLQYVHGQSQIIPGLEKQMEGLKAGDEKEVDVKSDEAYGPVNPNAFVEVPKDKLPEGELKPGLQLHSMDKSGQPIVATISEVKKDSVVMNLNHPLAGKDLHFKIKVVEVV